MSTFSKQDYFTIQDFGERNPQPLFRWNSQKVMTGIAGLLTLGGLLSASVGVSALLDNSFFNMIGVNLPLTFVGKVLTATIGSAIAGAAGCFVVYRIAQGHEEKTPETGNIS